MLSSKQMVKSATATETLQIIDLQNKFVAQSLPLKVVSTSIELSQTYCNLI